MPHRPYALVALAVTILGACDKQVGRICDLGVEDPGATEAVLASPSLDCPTKMCLKVPVAAGKDLPDDFQALPANRGLCTASCEVDDDCDVVQGSPCVTGFTCGIPLVVGNFCCDKVCICKDYVIVPESGSLATPDACDPQVPANGCCNLDGRAGDPDYPACP